MKLVQKVINKYFYLRNKSFMKKETEYCTQELLSKSNAPVIYYMCTPVHQNLGDQAQLVCIKHWYKENYPIHIVKDFCARTLPINWIELLKRQIKPDDMIFIHSGYLFMNETSDVPVILQLVTNFPDNKIVFLPQTVNFKSKQTEEKFVEAFATHHNLTLCCRDFVSYDMASKLFPSSHCMPFPDAVTSLIGTYKPKGTRAGVCFCLRDDKEKFYSETELQELIEKLSSYGCTRIDTTLRITLQQMNRHREDIIFKMIDKIAKSKIVITDRYHGTIFSVIANTPVIVINSTDHKLSSGVKWFPQDVFGKAIQYAEDLDTAYKMATEIIDTTDFVLSNPPYFRDKYWSMLKEQI